MIDFDLRRLIWFVSDDAVKISWISRIAKFFDSTDIGDEFLKVVSEGGEVIVSDRSNKSAWRLDLIKTSDGTEIPPLCRAYFYLWLFGRFT